MTVIYGHVLVCAVPGVPRRDKRWINAVLKVVGQSGLGLSRAAGVPPWQVPAVRGTRLPLQHRVAVCARSPRGRGGGVPGQPRVHPRPGAFLPSAA